MAHFPEGDKWNLWGVTVNHKMVSPKPGLTMEDLKDYKSPNTLGLSLSDLKLKSISIIMVKKYREGPETRKIMGIFEDKLGGEHKLGVLQADIVETIDGGIVYQDVERKIRDDSAAFLVLVMKIFVGGTALTGLISAFRWM